MASLLLVLVEQAMELSFHNHLQALHNAKKLSRMVFDECHTPLTQGSFRPCVQDLVDRWPVDVQWLILSQDYPRVALQSCVSWRLMAFSLRSDTSSAIADTSLRKKDVSSPITWSFRLPFVSHCIPRELPMSDFKRERDRPCISQFWTQIRRSPFPEKAIAAFVTGRPFSLESCVPIAHSLEQ